MPRLTSDERRAAVLSALERRNINQVALEHGIARQSLHRLVREATEDPDARLREAERELAFRRRVKALGSLDPLPEE